MKRTPLILAAALVFNLGIMTAVAEAQQRGQAPTPRSGSTSAGPVSPGSTSGAGVWDPTGTGGCTPGGIPGSGGGGIPCGAAATDTVTVYTFKLLPGIPCIFNGRPCGTQQFALACTDAGGSIQVRNRQTGCYLPETEAPRLERAVADQVRALTARSSGNRRPGASPPVRQD